MDIKLDTSSTGHYAITISGETSCSEPVAESSASQILNVEQYKMEPIVVQSDTNEPVLTINCAMCFGYEMIIKANSPRSESRECNIHLQCLLDWIKQYSAQGVRDDDYCLFWVEKVNPARRRKELVAFGFDYKQEKRAGLSNHDDPHLAVTMTRKHRPLSIQTNRRKKRLVRQTSKEKFLQERAWVKKRACVEKTLLLRSSSDESLDAR